MNAMSVFAFRNGCDRIVVCSQTLNDAQELAFEQCNNMSEPLYFLGETECTEEMMQQMAEQMMMTLH